MLEAIVVLLKGRNLSRILAGLGVTLELSAFPSCCPWFWGWCWA